MTERHTLPLREIALDWMGPGDDEPDRFLEPGQRALTLALQMLFLSGDDPVMPLAELLGLIDVLRSRGSYQAAQAIDGVVRASPPARALVEAAEAERRAHAQSRVDGTAKVAPMHAERAPEGSVALTDLMPPRTVIR